MDVARPEQSTEQDALLILADALEAAAGNADADPDTPALVTFLRRAAAGDATDDDKAILKSIGYL
jgi:hypothetical protein